MAKRLTPEEWHSIQEEWEAGQLDVSIIADSFGITAPAIFARAKRKGWPERRDKKAVVSGVVTNALVVTHPVTNVRTALMVFERALEVIYRHRKDIGYLWASIRANLDRVDELVARKAVSGRPLTIKEIAIIAAVQRDAANAYARLFALERKAFGFSDDKGPSELDGLTTAEIEAVRAAFRLARGES